MKNTSIKVVVVASTSSIIMPLWIDIILPYYPAIWFLLLLLQHIFEKEAQVCVCVCVSILLEKYNCVWGWNDMSDGRVSHQKPTYLHHLISLQMIPIIIHPFNEPYEKKNFRKWASFNNMKTKVKGNLVFKYLLLLRHIYSGFV